MYFYSNPDCHSIENEIFQAMVKANAISKDNSDDPKKVIPNENTDRQSVTDLMYSLNG